MNDMRTNQYFIEVRYNDLLLEVKEVWSDSENMAMMYAHKQALSQIESSTETPRDTEKRLALRLIWELRDKLNEARQHLHDWPEYMDDNDHDRERRRKLQETTTEWNNKLCELRQTFELKFDQSSY